MYGSKKEEDFFIHVDLAKKEMAFQPRAPDSFSLKNSNKALRYLAPEEEENFSKGKDILVENVEKESDYEPNRVMSVLNMEKGDYELYMPPGGNNEEAPNTPKILGRISQPVFSPLYLSSSSSHPEEAFKKNDEPFETFIINQKKNRRSEETNSSMQIQNIEKKKTKKQREMPKTNFTEKRKEEFIQKMKEKKTISSFEKSEIGKKAEGMKK